MLSDFFDTMGTAFGLATEAELLDEEGQIPHFESILVVDSLAAAAGGAASVSSNTSYIESAAGIGEGARTGIASLVTGGLFLIAMFFSPLVTVIPYEAAAPALVIVGFLMMTQIRHIDFDDYEIGIPAFLTIALMPFTYSITIGIGAGFVILGGHPDLHGQGAEHPLAHVGGVDRVPVLLRDLPGRGHARRQVAPNRTRRLGRMDPRTRRFVTLAVLISLTVVVVVAALRS